MKNALVSLFLFGGLSACDKAATTPVTPPSIVTAPAAAPAAAPTAAAPEQKLQSLTPAEVEKRRTEKNVFVFDNNNKERFEKGHVPGAKWVKPSEMTAAMLPPDKTATLVFYCANTSCG